MKPKIARIYKQTDSLIPTFEACHKDGAAIYRGRWITVNEVAILTAHQFNLDPSDPGTKHFLSLLVLRVCGVMTKKD